MRVLLVDDNKLFLRSAQRFLATLESVAVTTAHDGNEALAQLRRERPDLVLVDLNMPGMNGLEATRRIKELHPGLRVIVVSLHDSMEFQSAALRAGAERLIAKQEFASKIPLLLTAAAPVAATDASAAKNGAAHA